MSDESTVTLIVVLCLLAMFVAGTGLGVSLSGNSHYNENVCNCLGGKTYADVCVVDGRVVDIKAP